MDKELQNKLVKEYPIIFSEIGLSPQESCMAFGLEVGDGWYWIIDQLCSQLQFHTDVNNYPQVIVSQVKEKFGGLRFYVQSANREQYDIIAFAERLSNSICEQCGSTENVSKTKGGWITTLCDKCHIIREDEIKRQDKKCQNLINQFPI